MWVILIFIAVIAISICVSKYQKKKLLEELEQHILYADKNGKQSSIEQFMRTNCISDDEYHQVRRAMYEDLAQDDDLFAIKMAAAYAQNTPSLACKYTTRAAELGDVESMYTLGLEYSSFANQGSQGAGYGYDAEKSFYWFKKAADNGHEKAAYYVASAYNDGEGVEKDESLAIRYAKEQAECGNSECAFYLVDNHYCGHKTNYTEAVRLLERIMRRGEREKYAKAAHKLGFIFGTEFNNPYFDRRKAAYCHALAYIADADDLYEESAIHKSGYRASKFELEQWREDAINLRYNPL